MSYTIEDVFDDALNDGANYGRPQGSSLLSTYRNEASTKMENRFKGQLRVFLEHMPDHTTAEEILEILNDKSPSNSL